MTIGSGWTGVALRIAAGLVLGFGAADALDASVQRDARADPLVDSDAAARPTPTPVVGDCESDRWPRQMAGERFDPQRPAVPELRALVQRLEGHAARYGGWSTDDAERVLSGLAEQALLTVDCTAPPCIAVLEGVGIDELTARLHRQEGFESAIVGGWESEDFTVLVLWEVAPSASEKINARSRANQIREQLRASEEEP